MNNKESIGEVVEVSVYGLSQHLCGRTKKIYRNLHPDNQCSNIV